MPEFFEIILSNYLSGYGIFGYINKNGCYICTSLAHNKDGYCKKGWYGKDTYLHRIIYEIFYGEIPANNCIRHDCDTPGCVRPEHLRIGTTADNINDKLERGRQAKGEQIATSKLNEFKVREILKNANLGIPALAETYKVSERTIRDVLSRKTWKHVQVEQNNPTFRSKFRNRKRMNSKPSIHNLTAITEKANLKNK
jgi:hypothetical protein